MCFQVMEQELLVLEQGLAVMELDQVVLVQVALCLATLDKVGSDLALLALDWVVPAQDKVVLDQVVLAQDYMDLVEQGPFLEFIRVEVRDWEHENHQKLVYLPFNTKEHVVNNY